MANILIKTLATFPVRVPSSENSESALSDCGADITGEDGDGGDDDNGRIFPEHPSPTPHPRTKGQHIP